MIIGKQMSEQEFKDWHVIPCLNSKGFKIVAQEITVGGAGKVDIVAEKDNEVWFFELKRDDELSSIQQAIGQLCLYFAQGLVNYQKEVHLVLVLPCMFTNKLKPGVISHLKNYFRIEVMFVPYQWVMNSRGTPLKGQKVAYNWLRRR